RSTQSEDRNDLHVVRQRGRIFEWVRSIGVKETAAVGPEHLDCDLRRGGTDRYCLFGSFECCCVNIRSERLWHALPDQEQRVGHANRNEHVERAAGNIDPEAADGANRMPRKAANECYRKYYSGGR